MEFLDLLFGILASLKYKDCAHSKPLQTDPTISNGHKGLKSKYHEVTWILGKNCVHGREAGCHTFEVFLDVFQSSASGLILGPGDTGKK